MATTKYFILPSSTGANFTDFNLSYGSVTLNGEQVAFIGSTQVDAVFVRPGVMVDFTLSGSGADKIYLGGSFASYTSSITGSVMTLRRGSGATLESVSFIKSTSASTSDKIIFTDGTLNSLDLYANKTSGAALPALDTTETSLAPLAPALAGSVLNASIKAFALNSAGDTFAPARPGVAMTVVGNVGVDTVYVPRGGVVDCTLLGSGQDVIYFTGSWGDYTKAISGSVVTFSRTVDGYSESVRVVGNAANVSLNDQLVFADGAVRSGDAKTALATSLTVAISAVTGYDATLTTPGLAPTLNVSALNGVSNLEVGSNLVLHYSEGVTAVAGKYIHIVNDGGAGFHGENTVNTLDILVTDASQVSITGGRVTINPATDLDFSNNYHITIDAGAFTGVTSHQVSAAYDGTTSLQFSTVTPGVSTLANAATSTVLNAAGTLASGHLWLDIEGIGSPSANAGLPLDLSANNVALVARDYDPAGASPGYDGVKTGNFYVAANNFDAGDLIYIDNQGGAANDLTQTIFIDYGTPPTTVQFAGTELGGLVDISLAASSATFGTVNQLKSILGGSADPIFSDAASGQVDSVAPTVVSGSYGANDGNLGLGEAITLNFGFSEAVTVTGTPSIALANGGSAIYASGSTTNSLIFTYTPAAGQSAADLMTAAANALTGTIRDAAGNAVVASGFNNLNPPGIVSVNVDVDASVPVLQTVVAQGTTVTLTYSEALDPSHQPSVSYFQMSASTGSSRSFSGMQISGNTVTLTTLSPMLPGSSGTTYTLKYADPTASNDVYAIQDLAGNDAAGFTGQVITVNPVPGADTTAPTISTVSLIPGTGNSSLLVQFTESVNFTNGTGLSLTASNGTNIPITGVSYGASTDWITISTAATLSNTDYVKLTYSATGNIRDTSNNGLAGITIFAGGDGNNTITANTASTIRSNSGNDTVTGSSSNDTINAGSGADTIEGGYGADTIMLSDGSTRSSDTIKLLGNGSNNSWILGYDTLISFDVSNVGGTNNDILNLPSGTIAADTGITSATVVNGIAKYSVAGGIVSFYDASNAPLQINNTNKASALSFLSTNLTQAGRTVGFALDNDGNGQSDSLMVFQDGVAVNGFGFSDIAAQLNGVNGVTLSNTAGQNVVQIQDTTAASTVVRFFSTGDNAVLTFISSEDRSTASGTMPTFLVNGTVSANIVSRSDEGNITRQITDATLSQTDWLYYVGGNQSTDAAGNQNTPGSISVIGGSGNNVIDVSAANVGAATSTNISAYAGDDQITGTAVADTIWGGTGADIMSGGLGVDQFRFMQGDSPVATLNIGPDATLSNGDMFTFAGGRTDVVHGRFDIAGSGGDRIQLNSFTVANQLGLSSMGLAPTNGMVGNHQFYMVQGLYLNGSFMVNTTNGVDTLVVYDGDATAAVTQTALVVQGHAPGTLAVSNSTIYATAADSDSVAPTLTGAAVNGAILTLTFSETIDMFHKPAANPTILVNGDVRALVNGSIVGNVLTLTLVSPVVASDVVSFIYADPTSGDDANALQDLVGNDITGGGNVPVINNTPGGGDTIAPTLVSAVAQGTTLTLTYSEALDPTHQPSTSYFKLSDGTTTRAIQMVQVSGNTVTLTFGSSLLPASSGKTYTLNYSDPSAGNDAYAIQDLTGNDVSGFTGQAITVNPVPGADTTAPTILTVSLIPGTGNSNLLVQFTEAVNFIDGTGLSLTASNGTNIPITGVSYGASTDLITISTAATLLSTDYVKLTYSATGNIRDAANNGLAGITIYVGGDGNNTITANTASTIRSNGGNDTITGSSSNDTLQGGAGADTIEGGFGADLISLNDGSTPSSDTIRLLGNGSNNSWIFGYDTLTSFDVSNVGGINNDILNLPSGTIAADTPLTAGIAVNAVVGLGIAQHLIASGIIHFYNLGFAPILITNANKAEALLYLSKNITQAGRTVGFALDTDGNGQSDSLMVFQDGVEVNGFGFSDIAAQLNGVNGVTLSNTAGQNVVQIQDATASTPVIRFFSTGDNAVLTFINSEDRFAAVGTTPTFLVNGTVSANIVSRSDEGNITRQITDATLSQTDWLYYVGGNQSTDAAGNQNTSGSISVIGGSGNNVIDVSAANVGAATSTNISAYAGDDQITGTAVADTIWGGTGADIMSGGLGVDQFRFMQGDSPVATLNIGPDATLNTGDTFTFAGGKTDVVHGRFDVAGSSGDRIQLNSFTVANQFGLSSMGFAPANGIVGNHQFYMVQGLYLNGSFTVNTTNGVDTLVVYDGDASAAVTQTALVVQGRAPGALAVSGSTIYATAADSDSTAPTIVSASVDGLTLSINFSEVIDSQHSSNVLPVIMVNGSARAVSVSTISGATTTLTLSSPVIVGDVVTLSYTDSTSGDDANAIQDLAGNDVASISNYAVTNSTVVDNTVPVLQSAVAQGTTLTLTYSEALDPSHQPSASYFYLTASSGAERSILGMQVTGNTVLLQLSSALLPSALATYTLRYSDPSAGNDSYAIQDLAGNDAAGYTSQAITVTAPSGSDTTAPTILGVTITTPSTVTLQFSEAVSFANANGLTLINTTVQVPFTLSAGPTSDILVLTTSTALAASDVLSIVYYSGSGTIKDSSNNVLGDTFIMAGGDGVNTISAFNGFQARGNGGNDTINGGNSAESIIPGIGADTVNGNIGADTINLSEGVPSTDVVKLINTSLASPIFGYDSIYAFDVSNAGGINNDVLDLPSGTIAADTGITAGTAVNGIAKYSIASGIISFYSASNMPILITNTNKADALSFLASNLTQAGRTVGFALDSDGNGQDDSLMVFQDYVSNPFNGNGGSDIAALLMGVNGVTLSNTAGQNVVQIQDTTTFSTLIRSFSTGPNAVVTSIASEDIFPKPSETITKATILVNGIGSDVFVSTTPNGTNISTTQTSATLAQTDWLLWISGSNSMDAAGNFGTGGGINVYGGSGNNVIDASAVSVSGVVSPQMYGYDGDDQFTGTAVADTIWGGRGADTMSGGFGADYFRFTQGDSPVTTVNTGGDGTLNTGDVFTFLGGKADVVHGRFDVTGASGDRLWFGAVANQNYMTSMVAPTNGLVADQKLYTVRGNYVNGAFTVDTTGGVDTLVVYDGDGTSAISQTGVVVQGHAPSSLSGGGNTLYANVAETDVTPITVFGAYVNGLVVTFTFSEIVDAVHANIDPVFSVNGVVRPILDSFSQGSTAKFVLASPVTAGDLVTFSYTDPTAGDDADVIQDLVGNDMANISIYGVTNGTSVPANYLVGTNAADTLTLSLSAANGMAPATFVGGRGEEAGIDIAQIDVGSLAASFTGPLSMNQIGASLSWQLTDSSATPKIIADISQLITGSSYHSVVFHDPTNGSVATETLINMETLKLVSGGTPLFAWDLKTHATIPA